MVNSKNTKRALLTSALAILACAAMLIGTTFAWFTDTASTAVNKIVSGKLDVALEMWNGEKWVSAEGETLSFLQKQGEKLVQNADILWEPGATYQLPQLRVVNDGNLALKYTVKVTGIQGDAKLLKAIDFTVATEGKTEVAPLEDWEGVLLPEGAEKRTDTEAVYTSAPFTIAGTMKTTAGNEYQDLTIDGISVTVYATQYTYEYDSEDNQYDKNAPVIYPDGVTDESFAAAASVYYTSTWGGTTVKEDVTGEHPATVVYADKDGALHYAADLPAAMLNGAAVIYCKADTAIPMISAHTAALRSNLTLYANGANFNDGDIAFGSSTGWNTEDIDLKIYDANNLYVWGYSPANDTTVNVLMENCHNVGKAATKQNGRMFYISGKTGTINATLRNCSVEMSDSPVYMNANGSMTVENCTFIKCAVPVNNNYKANGTRTDVVKNCRFIDCGCTADMDKNIAEYAAPIRFVNSGSGTLKVTLTNNAISGTVGANGDILLGDYRNGNASHGFTTTITTEKPVMVKSSSAAASVCTGGTVTVD